MAKEWERHNSPTGTHIWCGQEHIADITGEGQHEVSKMAVTAHNACIKLNPENPLAVAEGMEDLKRVCREMVDFLYGYSESDKRVPDEWYRRFKAIYTKGFDALASIERGK